MLLSSVNQIFVVTADFHCIVVERCDCCVGIQPAKATVNGRNINIEIDGVDTPTPD